MRPVTKTTGAYRFWRVYVDLCTRSCYRKFKINGLENVPDPSKAAVIYAPNHTNTLMDALVLLRCHKGPTAFGARADMFRKPKTADLLRWFKILPLARSRDGARAIEENHAIFAEVVDCLSFGIPFAMFVEGTHRTKHSLLPIKKGIFHISQLALERLDKPVYIVPVGIDYTGYFHLKEDVTVTFGKPIDASQYAQDWVALRERIHDDLASLITYFPDDENYESAYKAYLEQKHPRAGFGLVALKAFGALCTLPVFAACALICSPLLLLTAFLLGKLKDKAWSNTVRYGCRLPFIIVWPFLDLFYLLLRFYRNIYRNIK